ncbi:hypothetical protein PRIPAC_70462, partial [Pristionchus pacificus]|uniref:F-box domain-containing protein n=1 Tax=Pristionchus pacificus TaxID=54126 RepID=A0A2A6CSM9_PRIPA
KSLIGSICQSIEFGFTIRFSIRMKDMKKNDGKFKTFSTDRLGVSRVAKDCLKMDVDKVNGDTTILSLPDDLLWLIFNSLTTSERFPLAFVCRRFRNADLDAGGKSFLVIDIFWYLSKEQKSKRDMRADFNLIAAICKSIAYEKMHVYIHTEVNSSENIKYLTSDLMSNRVLTNSEVTLQLRNEKFAPDVQKFRRLFMQIPKLRRFDLEFTGYSTNPRYCGGRKIFDDDTFLHVLYNVAHLKLNSINLSAQGLLKAFDMFCEKPLELKCVEILLPKSDIINDLFDMPDLKFAIEEKYEKDERKRHCVLLTTTNWTYHSVKMGKLAQNTARMRWIGCEHKFSN